MILLIGATGTIGSRVAGLLRGREDVRCLVRSDAAANRVAECGHAAVRGDLALPETLGPAFAGCAAVLLVTPFSRDQVKLELNALEAAEAAGVRHLVALSVMDAAPGVQVAMTRGHRLVEDQLAERGIPHTVLRPDWFASNTAGQVDLIRGGLITYPYGDAVTATIHPADVAEVAATALIADQPWNRTVELTGPEALTFRQSAERVEAVTGRPLTFLEASPDDWRGGLVAAGIEHRYADALLELLTGYAQRTGDPVRSGVPDTLGRPARPFEDYVRDELRL
ncbi:MAG: NAD(P)H-binding protein [Mycobacteriales bacterium]